jgi:hypothetical protein
VSGRGDPSEEVVVFHLQWAGLYVTADTFPWQLAKYSTLALSSANAAILVAIFVVMPFDLYQTHRFMSNDILIIHNP